MGYLIAKDYARSIQADNLSQITGGDQSIIDAAEALAVATATSYLVQKYDVVPEFKSTSVFDATSVLYSVGDRVTDIAGAGGVMYFAATPKPVFNLSNIYAVGDQVFWKGKTYTCLIATSSLSQSDALQIRTLENIPFSNVFPDDVNRGRTYWGAGVTYSIPINTLTNPVYWTKGDNRDQQIKAIVVNIALYEMHMRIAPRNIPDLRVKAFDNAISTLKGFAKGETTAALPKLQPKSGGRIRYGGNIRNVNSY